MVYQKSDKWYSLERARSCNCFCQLALLPPMAKKHTASSVVVSAHWQPCRSHTQILYSTVLYSTATRMTQVQSIPGWSDVCSYSICTQTHTLTHSCTHTHSSKAERSQFLKDMQQKPPRAFPFLRHILLSFSFSLPLISVSLSLFVSVFLSLSLPL